MHCIPVLNDILLAHDRIKGYVHRTPVMTSSGINGLSEADVYFKCENFQKVGAFKYRGAANAVLSLTEQEAGQGVATHSSGNHAAALALAAKIRGIKCQVVMPRTSPVTKIEAVRSYGADITFCEPDLKSREDTLQMIVEKTGAVFIHPYDNFRVICGQGTAAKEFLEDKPELEVILAPVGGGGLLSGTALYVKAINPEIKVYGCEPAGADDASRSFKTGILQTSVNPKTIADGLLTSLSELTFEIIKGNVSDILTVSEESIVNAMILVWQRVKIIIEPSSAVTLAAIMENRNLFSHKKTGIILSGGNVDLLHLPFSAE
jgi:threonine dehydratase